MDMEDAFVVEERTGRGFRGVLNFGAITDGCVLVGGKLTLLGVRVIPLEAQVGNVVIRGEATGALGVVPLENDAGVQITLPVLGDIIVFFEGISKVVVMAVAYIFNTKVLDNEAEEDRAPFVAPKTGIGGALVLSVLG